MNGTKARHLGLQASRRGRPLPSPPRHGTQQTVATTCATGGVLLQPLTIQPTSPRLRAYSRRGVAAALVSATIRNANASTCHLTFLNTNQSMAMAVSSSSGGRKTKKKSSGGSIPSHRVRALPRRPRLKGCATASSAAPASRTSTAESLEKCRAQAASTARAAKRTASWEELGTCMGWGEAGWAVVKTAARAATWSRPRGARTRGL